MGSFGKRFIVIVFLGVILIAGGIVLYLNSIARTAIERGAGYAFGVETRVGSVQLGLLSGRFGVGGIEVGNPQGFESPRFFSLQEGRLAVGLRSLLADTVEVPEFTLDGIEIYLERRGRKTNYGSILENLGRFESKETAPASVDAAEESQAKKFVIAELMIRDVAARLRFAPELGELAKVDVEIPEIRLSNVGSETGGGVLISELSGIVLKAVLEAVAGKRGDLPGQIGNDLRTSLAPLGRVGGDVVGEVGRFGDDARKRATGALEETTRGLGGLLKRGEEE
jgi:hypothetical protein